LSESSPVLKRWTGNSEVHLDASNDEVTTTPSKLVDEIERSYFGYLLVSLMFLLLVVPIIERSAFAPLLLRGGITAVLISAALVTPRRRLLLVLGLLVVGVAAPMSWMTFFVENGPLVLCNSILEGVFFVVMAVAIVLSVMRRHLASLDSIFGAISAYLLLGLAWAMIYWGIGHVDGNAFAFGRSQANADQFSQCVYFSFVTMSTLGYGEITPQTSVARTLTWMQAVTGQFYIAVLVAWVVSQIPKHTLPDRNASD
jgi:voltage-gated potassium channel